MDLFQAGGPLQDAVNPPARYTLESDSEDELGGGEYEDGKHVQSKGATTTAQTHQISLNLDQSEAKGKHLIVGVGEAGARFGSITGSGINNATAIQVDNIPVGTYHSLSGNTAFAFISSSLPATVLHPLSEELLKTIQPQKLAILDIYPTAQYISQTRQLDPPIRFLRTSSSSPNDAPLSSLIQHFGSPNLLSTQTISSSLIVLAQQKQLPATLLLLPYPRVPPLPPRTLSTSTSHKLEDEVLGYSHEWTRDILQLVNKTLLGSEPALLEKANKMSAELPVAGAKSHRVRGDIGEGGMYI
ncbi:hypothetical protein FRC03_001943 [Tulasnella sp. 419]|nr:hypothetical protein FRC03_001943 [Tulasnella sp. 419]